MFVLKITCLWERGLSFFAPPPELIELLKQGLVTIITKRNGITLLNMYISKHINVNTTPQ